MEEQRTAADLVMVTKSDTMDNALSDRLTQLGARRPTCLPDSSVADLLFDITPLPQGRSVAPHPHYTRWSHISDTVHDRRTLGERLTNRPAGLYRLKGHVLTNDGPYEVHIVGQYVEARRTQDASQTVLVALGPAERLSTEDIENWWSATP